MKKFALIVALANTGCADTSQPHSTEGVGYLQYSNLSCAQLEMDMTRLDAALAEASRSEQHSAASIAIYEGQEKALHDASLSKKCDAVDHHAIDEPRVE